MKKLFILIVIGSAMVISAQAQKLDAAQVPAVVKAAFAAKYPGFSPHWEKEDGKYEASFKQDDKNISALFKPSGQFSEAEVDIKLTDLPPTIPVYVNQHFPGKTVKGGSKISKADGTINYEVSVNGKDLIFDVNGKFIKAEKD